MTTPASLTLFLVALLVQEAQPERGGFEEAGARVLFDWRGDAAGEQFGWVARPAGDVNGDGREDVILGAPFRSTGGAPAGRVLVCSGADGALLFEKRGAGGEQLGRIVCGLGDQDGDGRADLIVGAWTNSQGAPAAGKAYLLSGADFSVLRTFTSTIAGEAMGFDATGLGDLDGDGRREPLLTGAYHPAAGPQTGRVVVLSGGPGPRER